MSQREPMPHRPDERTLEYAPAKAPLAHPLLFAVVATLGTLLGVFGLVMIGYGVFGVGYVILHGAKRDRAEDLFQVGLFLVIGSFCLSVAVRWWTKRTWRRSGS